MSTKALNEVLVYFRNEASNAESPRATLAARAQAEVEAIERASKATVADWDGDGGYDSHDLDAAGATLRAIAKDAS